MQPDSQDILENGDEQSQFVYPWPQFIKQTKGDKGQEKYEITYPGDADVIAQTGAYSSQVWPEVEFVEEYMKGLTEKFNPPVAQPPIDNESTTNIVNINAIEYPSSGIAYQNKEEIKFGDVLD